eukprot:s20_g25.t3
MRGCTQMAAAVSHSPEGGKASRLEFAAMNMKEAAARTATVLLALLTLSSLRSTTGRSLGNKGGSNRAWTAELGRGAAVGGRVASRGRADSFVFADGRRLGDEPACPTDCVKCSSIGECLQCTNAKYLNPLVWTCEEICPEGFHPEGTGASNRTCTPCAADCAKCNSASECVFCKNNKYLSPAGSCGFGCPPGYQTHGDDVTGRTCWPCPPRCRTCTDWYTCDVCETGAYLLPNRTCLEVCDHGYFRDDSGAMAETGGVCTECYETCSKCTGRATCQECQQSTYLSRYYQKGLAEVGNTCEDLALLREGHANFVRGAHYPQDQRWLDRLDESGMAMWEETLGPGVWHLSFVDAFKVLKQFRCMHEIDWGHFMKYQLQQVDEMLAASMNHPSIMAWAWFNEGPSNELAACQAYLQCSLRAAEQDPTRFRTWASNKKEDDKCLEHATAVSFNSYPAWYSEKQDLSAPKREWTASAAWAKRNFPDKPFFISETGAGGLYEWATNATDAYWTLKYQREVIDADVDVALADSNVSGLTLWHFFDFKGNDEAQICGPCQYLPGVQPPTCGWYNMSGHCENRPGGLNHKGVLDPYRRKKPSFSAVAQKYGQHAPAESGPGHLYMV